MLGYPSDAGDADMHRLVPYHPASIGAPTMVVQPQIRDGLFIFKRLSCAGEEVLYATMGWRFTDNSADPWTARFNGFKAQNPRAIKVACALVPDVVVPIASGLGKEVTVVATHGHADTSLNRASAVCFLAAALAKRHGWKFEPELLTHKSHEQLSKASNISEREARIAGTYSAKKPQFGRVLIVDDLVTNGSTAREIARALRRVDSSVRVYGFALGKTERVEYARGHGLELTNGHLDAELAKRWDSYE